MSDVLAGIEVVLFLGTLVAAIPYAIWVAVSAWKRRWRKVAFQCVCPLIAYFAIAAILDVFHRRAYREYLTGIFGVEVILDAPTFSFHSERSFNGDGYSIDVYSLPSVLEQRFLASDEATLSGYPKRPSVRGHWSVHSWKRSPFDEQYRKYLDFALSEFDARDERRLRPQFDAIRAALQRSGCYYAFFHLSHDDLLGNVDFFIVDLEGKQVYTINHNT